MNLWWVIQFSAAASVVAAVILGLKLLFHDKLDARWHYLIWLVLLVRMLVPLQLDYIRTPVSLFEAIPVLQWLRMCELAAHQAGLDGIMDALFGAYLAGAALLLFHDLICYLVLRFRIVFAKECGKRHAGVQKGMLQKAPEEVCRRVEDIAQKYGLKTCWKICVQDTPTPYVCGLQKTALVLTREMAYRLEKQESAGFRAEKENAALDPDEAVILHELLHRKYMDVLVNFLLHLVRALNWFNPFIWYVTGVVQNDSEALCDQRVLEYMERASQEGDSCEKEYGMLLIDMASGNTKNPIRIGTSNMANSFRNMKTRIHRIADFKKVPSGIGIVTLCITLILSISGIGYCREGKALNSTVIRSERDLRLSLLSAQLYMAESPAEALYLYLSAMQNGNPVYLMAVLPNDMRQDFGAWVLEHYGNEAFFDHNVWVEEWEESPYFPQRPFWLTDFRVFNLDTIGQDRAQAGVLVSYKQDELLWWELEFFEEDGWKIRRRSDEPVEAEAFEEPPLYRTTGEGGSFRVELDCWNEGYFDDLNRLSSGIWSTAEAWERGEGSGKEKRFPGELSMEYKMSADYLIYTGKKDLADSTVGVVILENGTDENSCEEYFQAMEHGVGRGGSVGSSLYDNIIGADLMENERVQVGGGGSGPDRWDSAAMPSWHVWIYVDQEFVEEFEVSPPAGQREAP